MPDARGLAVNLAGIFLGPLANLMRRRRLARRSPRRRPRFEPLERRLLLSADPAALYVVDGSVEDHAELLDLPAVYLDASQDGIAQISAALADNPGISALHIVSHGSSGSLQLGSATLDAASLGAYQDQLRAWAQALTADADILFYGCNLAADELGIGFVEELSRLTD